MRIDITNGYVEIRDFIPRPASKAYKAALANGVVFPREGEAPTMPVINIDLAQEAIVLGMVTKVVINEEAVADIQGFLTSDDFHDSDYDKIAVECQRIKNAASPEKNGLIEAFKRLQRGTATEIPQEIGDFILIRDLYHCPPSQLDKEDGFLLDLHLSLLAAERKSSSGVSAQDRISKTRNRMGK